MSQATLIVPLATPRDIGRYLGAVMELSDCTVRQITRDLGVNASTFSLMMHGHRPWRRQTLDAALDYLAVKGEARERLESLARDHRVEVRR